MFKTLPVVAFVAVMSLSPAYAAGECTEAHMKQMDGMIAKMTDAAKQKEATMHLDMSKGEMKKGNFWGLPASIAFFSFIALFITAGTVVLFGERLTNPADIVERVGRLV